MHRQNQGMNDIQAEKKFIKVILFMPIAWHILEGISKNLNAEPRL